MITIVRVRVVCVAISESLINRHCFPVDYRYNYFIGSQFYSTFSYFIKDLRDSTGRRPETSAGFECPVSNAKYTMSGAKDMVRYNLEGSARFTWQPIRDALQLLLSTNNVRIDMSQMASPSDSRSALLHALNVSAPSLPETRIAIVNNHIISNLRTVFQDMTLSSGVIPVRILDCTTGTSLFEEATQLTQVGMLILMCDDLTTFRTMLLTPGTIVICIQRSQQSTKTETFQLGHELGITIVHYVLSSEEVAIRDAILIDTRRFFSSYSFVVADMFSQHSARNGIGLGSEWNRCIV
jgi:hypothetical protein